MKIRKAKKEDLKEMMSLSYSLFSKFEKLDSNDKLIKNYFGSKKQYNDILKEMKNRKNCFFVAETNEKITGWLLVNIFDNWPMYKIRKKGNFGLLIVDSKYRKKGIGNRLVNEGYKWFKQKGIKNFTVTTHALDKKANSFWKHIGFKQYNIKFEK
jgi:ribosomal protein S18 acetylase RimI-like enzyme|tara:strand:- start:26 stop:490 length:465 start_codon:yes stop_codon:yes gene_type:complete